MTWQRAWSSRLPGAPDSPWSTADVPSAWIAVLNWRPSHFWMTPASPFCRPGGRFQIRNRRCYSACACSFFCRTPVGRIWRAVTIVSLVYTAVVVDTSLTLARRFMLPVFLFLPSLAALPINTRLGDWGGVSFFFFHRVNCWKMQLCLFFFLLPFISFVFFLGFFFFFHFWSVGIYAPSPAPTLTLSHMLIWHFLLKGHGWIMFCRRGSSCYMKNDAAGVFSRRYVAIWTTNSTVYRQFFGGRSYYNLQLEGFFFKVPTIDVL